MNIVKVNHVKYKMGNVFVKINFLEKNVNIFVKDAPIVDVKIKMEFVMIIIVWTIIMIQENATNYVQINVSIKNVISLQGNAFLVLKIIGEKNVKKNVQVNVKMMVD